MESQVSQRSSLPLRLLYTSDCSSISRSLRDDGSNTGDDATGLRITMRKAKNDADLLREPINGSGVHSKRMAHCQAVQSDQDGGVDQLEGKETFHPLNPLMLQSKVAYRKEIFRASERILYA